MVTFFYFIFFIQKTCVRVSFGQHCLLCKQQIDEIERRCASETCGPKIGAGFHERCLSALAHHFQNNFRNVDVSSQSKSKPPTPVDDLPKSIVPPQKRTTTASVGASGWRSKSMNVKHTATTKLAAPKSVAPTLQVICVVGLARLLKLLSA